MEQGSYVMFQLGMYIVSWTPSFKRPSRQLSYYASTHSNNA